MRRKAKYTLISIRQRVMNRPLPEVELIDMGRDFQDTGHEHLFSRALIEQTQAALDRGRTGADSAQPARLFLSP